MKKLILAAALLSITACEPYRSVETVTAECKNLIDTQFANNPQAVALNFKYVYDPQVLEMPDGIIALVILHADPKVAKTLGPINTVYCGVRKDIVYKSDNIIEVRAALGIK